MSRLKALALWVVQVVLIGVLGVQFGCVGNTKNSPSMTQPVTITGQPVSQTLLAGQTATFSVNYMGATPITFQWRKDSLAIASGTSSTLTINSVTTSDAGGYSVVVTNPVGNVTSNVATLTVNTLPAITTQPASLTVTEGQPAQFSVTANGTAPLSYQWKKDGADIPSANAATYSIPAAHAAHIGTYRVAVSNPFGTVTSNPATLAVNLLTATTPVINTQPTDALTVVQSGTAIFSITASGNGALSYQWTKGGVNLINGGTISGATTPDLHVTNVLSGDAGSYACVVTNTLNGTTANATSNAGVLNINFPPTFSTQPVATQTLPQGGTATFTVAASGSGTLSYQWLKGSTPLVNGGNVAGATGASLVLSNLQSSDAGNYSCQVTNTLGGTSTNATSGTGVLSVTAPPTHFVVGGFPTPTVSGVAHTFTVTAQDAVNSTVPSYTGTIHFTSSDPSAVLPADYTFTSGDNGVHTFTATLATAGTRSLVATDTATSITGSQTGITVNAAAATRLSVTGYPTSTVAGTAHSVTVTAFDSANNQATGYTGTVHFTSTDGAAVLPANYTFVAGDAGAHSFVATFGTVGVQTLTATDQVTASINGAQTGITVTPAAATHFAITGFPASTPSGAPQTFTVTALDGSNNTATGYTGTVSFTSSDSAATLPGNFTFTAGDNGVHTFSATLATAGSQSMTVTDTVNNSVTGSAAGISVNASTATHFTITGYPASTIAGVQHACILTALDASNNPSTGYVGTIHFTSSDVSAVLPANFTFTGGDSGVHTFNITLTTAGAQSITATDIVTASITGSASGITVSAAAASHLSVTGYPSTTVMGVSHNFTVQVLDAWNNLVPTYTGSVHTTSSDPAAVLPADYTFIAGDAGNKALSATLATTGTQVITVTDTVNASITGSHASITVGTAAPTIQTQPQTKTVLPPDAVTFTVIAQANGGGPLTYVWKKNGTAIVGATSVSYTVLSTEFATNTDAYSVTVNEGSYSTDSNTVYALAAVTSPTYAGDPVPIPSRPLTILPSLHVDAVNFPNGAFRLGYDETLKNPVWTSYVNFPVHSPYANSTADYTTDLRLAAPQVGKDDYTGIYTGGANFPNSYDRGHQVPRADVSYRYTPVAGDDATIMSNLVPQISQFNQQTWQKLEDAIGGTAGGDTDGLTSFKGRVWVYTGSVFPASPTWWNSTITPGLQIAIPVACYKIVVHEVTSGHPEVLAMLMPNVWGLTNSTATLTSYVTSVARIEALTGIDFFPNLATVAPSVDTPTWKATVDVRGWRVPFEQATGPNVHVIQPSYDTTIDVGTTLTLDGAATPSAIAPVGTTIANTTWNFGDASPTTTGTSTSHTFNTTGSFNVTFTADDSLGSNNTITRVVRVIPPASSNSAPTTNPAVLPAQTSTVDQAVTVNFTVADDRTTAGALTVSAVSDNATLLPASGIVVSNASGAVTLVLTPATGQTGSTTVTVTVTDGDAAFITRTFLLTVSAASTNVLTEGFESGTKGGYVSGSVAFPSGSWVLNNALVGTSASDRKTGLQSIRSKVGTVTMSFDWPSAQTVSINHAKYGADADSTWELWYSTDAGGTWTQTGVAVVTNSTTLSPAIFNLNLAVPIRFEIRNLTLSTTARVNFDDFQITGY